MGQNAKEGRSQLKAKTCGIQEPSKNVNQGAGLTFVPNAADKASKTDLKTDPWVQWRRPGWCTDAGLGCQMGTLHEGR